MKNRLRELDLNLLVVLEALIRNESVSRAAEDLNMSQSAVSHALKRLRELFDDELFIRSREGMAPTPKIMEISGYVKEILRLAEITMLPSHSFDPETSDRTVTLALGDAGDMAMLPILTKHIRQNGGNTRIVSIQATAEQALTQLGSGDLDLYVGTMNAVSSDLLCQKLYDDRLVVIASQMHRVRKTISFEAYSAAEHIVVQARTSTPTASVPQMLFEQHNIQRKVRIKTPHLAAVPMILEKDHQLISTVPLALAEYFRRSAKIKIIEPEFFLPNVEVSQYWHRRYTNDPFILWLRRTIRELFQNKDLAYS